MGKFTTKAVRFVGASILSILAGGCATYRYAASYPATAPISAPEVMEEQPSGGTQFPVGTFYDKEHRLAFNGHQKGTGVGMMFGLVGVLVTHQANKSAGAARFGEHTQALNVDLVEQTRIAIGREIDRNASERLTIATPNAEVQVGATLEVLPYGLVDFSPHGDAKVYAVIRARLLDHSGKELWLGRYFCAATGTHMQSTWESDGRLEAALQEATDRAAWALVQDIEGNFSGTRTAKVAGRWAWMNRPLMGCKAMVIAEHYDWIVLRFAVGDALLFAGTHVVERKDVQLNYTDFKMPSS